MDICTAFQVDGGTDWGVEDLGEGEGSIGDISWG